MNPKEAYRYASLNGPSEKTRKIACTDPEYAYNYARDIDKKPSEQTRNAACRESQAAILYMQKIDKGFHEDTWKTVKNTEYKEKYIKMLNSLDKEKII